jgi:hypothetical protein
MLLLAIALIWLSMESALAVEVEPLGKAVMAVLGTSKAMKRTVPSSAGETTVFVTKDASGKVSRAAFIQKGIYQPNCTHTWVVGIDGKSGKVTQVRVVEMSCPHAFPTKSASFLDQFKGKGPADAAKLDAEVSTVAKATGSSKLTTDAVKRSITSYKNSRAKL